MNAAISSAVAIAGKFMVILFRILVRVVATDRHT